MKTTIERVFVALIITIAITLGSFAVYAVASESSRSAASAEALEEAFDEFYASSEAVEEAFDELAASAELIRLGKIARLDCLLEGEAVDAINTQIVHLETVVGNDREFALGMAQLAYLEERADTASENARITCERFHNARR